MADVEIVAGTGEVSMAVGDTLTLRLPENATTGYVWSLAERPPGLVLEDDRSVPGVDTAIGSGGEHLFRWRAEQPGDWRVALRLAREWEPAAREERQLSVRVD
jgi:inhibitor of cysteine peptidase